jgi:hypothetical protein
VTDSEISSNMRKKYSEYTKVWWKWLLQ